MIVHERFVLPDVETVNRMTPYGEFLFYRTYSLSKGDGSMESWIDVCRRVTEGTFSIRKDHYMKNGIEWKEDKWMARAKRFFHTLMEMHWSPPGRGLFKMGTDFVYENGSMCLSNCAYVLVKDMAEDFAWMMDALMLGVGAGFQATNEPIKLYEPKPARHQTYIHDSRLGWTSSVRDLIKAYTMGGREMPIFNYSLIRPYGMPIRGFGGKASGPEPLIRLHKFISEVFGRFRNGHIGQTELVADIGNMIGVCVVAGNVRRSAEIYLGSVQDDTFLNLKIEQRREQWAFMSNNTALLEHDEDFDKLSEVTNRVIERGEPGLANLRNFPFGRLGRTNDCRIDLARGLNPCGEITLEDKELCCIAETYPTNCRTKGVINPEIWLSALEDAAFYCNTIQLLRTHQPCTNRVIARNRRIGIGIAGFTDWASLQPMHQIIPYLRRGYSSIRSWSKEMADEAGVPEPIKITTIKPGGTVPPVCSRNDTGFDSITSGCGYPTFTWCGRRVRVAKNNPIYQLLVDGGVPHEPEKFDPERTEVFTYPLHKGPAKPASKTNIWEQMNNIIILQREWADNAVSNTIYFRPEWRLERVWFAPFPENIAEIIGKRNVKFRVKIDSSEEWIEWAKFDTTGATQIKLYHYDKNHEEDELENLISSSIGQCKSISLLPISGPGVYDQMPEYEITQKEYNAMRRLIGDIDYESIRNMEVVETDNYCSGDVCSNVR